MYKILKADKDTYITDRVIRNNRVTGSNVGAAATLDLFKLYGATLSGTAPNAVKNTELSRILIHFDLQDLKDLVTQKKIDIDDPSFFCKIKLKDVYGGQPTPVNFTVSVFPLSASFVEGIGKDNSFYSDRDWCNWMSSSFTSQWALTGCAGACFATGSGDYITSSLNITSTEITQTFSTGEEDLEVDVTKIVSATISGELPDRGFRISFSNSLEVDQQTYFVKRFGSRHVYDTSKQPKMVFGFDDSIFDDTQNLTFDKSCRVTLYNFSGGDLDNIVSGSSLSAVTGSNSLFLKLTTAISGGHYDLYFTGSQFSPGSTGGKNFVSGTYYADVTLPSTDVEIKKLLLVSSSIQFTPVWTSLDKSVAYVTGSSLSASPPSRVSSRRLKKYVVSALGVKDAYLNDEEAVVRIHIFDQTSPFIKVTRIPVEMPGVVVKNVYYQIRDAVTNEIVVPYDDVKNSTKVSSDSEGMFFKLDTSSLGTGRTYVVDVMISHEGVKTRYTNVSPVFRVNNSEDQQ